MEECKIPDRSLWGVYLAFAPREAIIVLCKELSARFLVTMLKPATAGLGMLQILDSVRGDAFHMGEFTVVQASVRLTDESGDVTTGGVVLMSDDEELARCIAILDAVLAGRFDGCARVADLVRLGEVEHLRRDEQRKRILTSTAVDFSTLGEDT